MGIQDTLKAAEKAYKQGIVHKDFYRVLQIAAEKESETGEKLNLLGTMNLFVDGPDDVDGVTKINRVGNPAEKALATNGTDGVRNSDAAAIGKDGLFNQILEEIEHN